MTLYFGFVADLNPLEGGLTIYPDELSIFFYYFENIDMSNLIDVDFINCILHVCV